MRQLHAVAVGMLFISSLFILPMDASAQNNAVRWSTFDMGFAVPASSTTKIKSAVGQSFVGTSRSGNTRIDSGFLADTLLRGTVTDVRAEGTPSIPLTFGLGQNYPNPFNPSTTIKYDLPEPGKVSLIIYDVLGRRVAELVNEEKASGYHSITWNVPQSGIASGVYLARFIASDANGYSRYSKVNKLILMK